MPYDLTPAGEEVGEPGHQAGVKLEADGFGDDGGVVNEAEGFPVSLRRCGPLMFCVFQGSCRRNRGGQ